MNRLQHSLLLFVLEARLGAKVRHCSNLSEGEARGALRLVHLADAFVIGCLFAFSVRHRFKLPPIASLAELIPDFGENRLGHAHVVIVLVPRRVRHHSKLHVSVLLLQRLSFLA